MRHVFLVLAVIGILPWVNFYAWFQENGWSLSGMIDAWYVNEATAGLVRDLSIAAVALTLWILVECIRRRDWPGLLAIPATFGIGLSCGLPLYIWLRSRHEDR
ncbi:DUF2834 domain-containing protein [Rhodobacterales bacterium HKCCE3408]|nr:DUF2834 domain-containing protein [Rhodobacterales bacterium HKCCE3408]